MHGEGALNAPRPKRFLVVKKSKPGRIYVKGMLAVREGDESMAMSFSKTSTTKIVDSMGTPLNETVTCRQKCGTQIIFVTR